MNGNGHILLPFHYLITIGCQISICVCFFYIRFGPRPAKHRAGSVTIWDANEGGRMTINNCKRVYRKACLYGTPCYKELIFIHQYFPTLFHVANCPVCKVY